MPKIASGAQTGMHGAHLCVMRPEKSCTATSPKMKNVKAHSANTVGHVHVHS